MNRIFCTVIFAQFSSSRCRRVTRRRPLSASKNINVLPLSDVMHKSIFYKHRSFVNIIDFTLSFFLLFSFFFFVFFLVFKKCSSLLGIIAFFPRRDVSLIMSIKKTFGHCPVVLFAQPTIYHRVRLLAYRRPTIPFAVLFIATKMNRK